MYCRSSPLLIATLFRRYVLGDVPYYAVHNPNRSATYPTRAGTGAFVGCWAWHVEAVLLYCCCCIIQAGLATPCGTKQAHGMLRATRMCGVLWVCVVPWLCCAVLVVTTAGHLLCPVARYGHCSLKGYPVVGSAACIMQMDTMLFNSPCCCCGTEGV